MRQALTAFRNNRGVTLVEVMISLVILLFVFMGLIQVSILSIDYNRNNAVRDEAVRLASEVMGNLKAFGFGHAELSATGWVSPPMTAYPVPVRRTVVNYPQDFTVEKQVQDLSVTVKRVSVRVTYTYRNDPPVTYTLNANVVQEPL